MRLALFLLLTAACGRIGFDPPAGTDGGTTGDGPRADSGALRSCNEVALGSCVCPAGGDCSAMCTSSPCEVRCEAASTCDINCTAACSIACLPGSICDFRCFPGPCTVTGEGASVSGQCVGTCDLTCDAASTCDCNGIGCS